MLCAVRPVTSRMLATGLATSPAVPRASPAEDQNQPTTVKECFADEENGLYDGYSNGG